MTTFFIADTHFGHKEVINLYKRPFASIEQMDEILMAVWNDTVKEKDTVYFLGDFAWKGSLHLFQKLHGEKNLVRGNHDDERVLRLNWKSVCDNFIGEIEGTKLHLSHYPLRAWASQWRGAIHLYGHVHNTMKALDGSLDVGVESLCYRPISLDEVRMVFKTSGWLKD